MQLKKMLAWKSILVMMVSLTSVQCRLPFTWGKKNDTDLLVCAADRTWDPRTENGFGHTVVYGCTLPPAYSEFTYVQVWAVEKNRSPNDFRISMVHDVRSRYMYFEVECQYSFHVRFQFYAKKYPDPLNHTAWRPYV